MTELAMFTKITRDDGIGRMFKTQQLAEHGLGMGKQGGGKTGGFHGLPNSVATCSKMSPFLSV